MKNKYLQCKEWIFRNPKQVYKNVMILLILSFALIFVQHIYFTPKISMNKTPILYSKSDNVKMDMKEIEIKMESIVKELQKLKSKREGGPLTTNDSLRIEYLFNHYQKLKNGL